MTDEILVYRHSIFCFCDMYPFWIRITNMCFLLKDQNIGGYFCSCIFFEWVFRKSDGSSQISSSWKILSKCSIMLVQRSFRWNSKYNSTRSDQIQRFSQKVVMNFEIVFCILVGPGNNQWSGGPAFIRSYFILTVWSIANLCPWQAIGWIYPFIRIVNHIDGSETFLTMRLGTCTIIRQENK